MPVPIGVCNGAGQGILFQGIYTREMADKDLDIMRTGDMSSFATKLILFGFFPSDPKEPKDLSGTTEDWIARTAQKYGQEADQLKEMIKGMADSMENGYLCAYAYWKELCTADFRGLLKDISVPTLAFYALPGSVYQKADAEYYVGRIPNCTTHRVGDVHWNIGTPETVKEYIDTIVKFCE